jgi:methionyl-tRNA formyltransferase
LQDPAISTLSAETGFKVEAATDVNSEAFVQPMMQLKPALAIIAGFSTIFKKKLYSVPKFGTINLHGGRLPKYRGGSPLNWQIINGEKSVGISILQVDDGIDSGDLLAEGNIDLDRDGTIADAHKRANELFPQLMLGVIAELDKAHVKRTKQNEKEAEYWHQRSEQDGRVRFDCLTGEQVHNLVRGITRPYPGAFAFYGGRKVWIWRTSIASRTINGTPGRVCWISGEGPYVICRDRAVLIKEFEIENAPTERLRQGSSLQ